MNSLLCMDMTYSTYRVHLRRVHTFHFFIFVLSSSLPPPRSGAFVHEFSLFSRQMARTAARKGRRGNQGGAHDGARIDPSSGNLQYICY